MASPITGKPSESKEAPRLRRVVRKFSSDRKSAEVVRSLLLAHCVTA